MEDKEAETMKERIIGLLRKGYKRGQLIHDFEFAERTVDAAIRAYKELSNGNAGGGKESGSPTADEEVSAPPSKSRGKGATGTAGREGLLAIRKEKESLLQSSGKRERGSRCCLERSLASTLQLPSEYRSRRKVGRLYRTGSLPHTAKTKLR
jgi:hypothetical protein